MRKRRESDVERKGCTSTQAYAGLSVLCLSSRFCDPQSGLTTALEEHLVFLLQSHTHTHMHNNVQGWSLAVAKQPLPREVFSHLKVRGSLVYWLWECSSYFYPVLIRSKTIYTCI